MQTLIDFLVNNYLWFIIISLILVFALIGYLVDTSERTNKSNKIEDSLDSSSMEVPTKFAEPIPDLNMDMGEEVQEFEKDVIVMPQNNVERSLENMEEQLQKATESTEILEID